MAGPSARRSAIYLSAVFVGLMRPYNMLLPVAGCIIGYLADGSRVPNRQFWLALVSLVLTHGLVTVWNDLADEPVDVTNLRLTVKNVRTAGQLGIIKWLTVAFSVIIIVLISQLPAAAAILIIFLLLLGIAYDFPPLQLSRRPLASIAVLAICYGTIPLLVGAAVGHFHEPVIWLAAAWTLLRSSLSLLKDYKDAPGDAVHHKRTFLLVYGGRLVARASLGLAAIGFTAAIVVLNAIHSNLAISILAVIVVIWLLVERAALLKAGHYDQLHAIFRRCLHYQLVFDVVVIAWLAT